jgi:hypothetical protein
MKTAKENKQNNVIEEVAIKESAQAVLNKFLTDNKITLDYEIINQKSVVPTADGFILVASKAPAVKVTAKYVE